jgi:hypothetical protein
MKKRRTRDLGPRRDLYQETQYPNERLCYILWWNILNSKGPKSIPVIARELGLPVDTVYSLKTQALRRIEKNALKYEELALTLQPIWED